MKQLTLEEQAGLFIDSDITYTPANDLCEWMDIESNVNVKKGMVEEDESKNVQISATENVNDDGENVVAAHIPSSSAVSAMISETEEMFHKCNILFAASSQRRAEREIELERKVHRGGKTGQRLLTEMMRMIN